MSKESSTSTGSSTPTTPVVNPAYLATSRAISFTALHEAIELNDTKRAKQLILSGADIDAKDSLQRTPLFYSAVTGNKEIASLLIKKGAIVTNQAKDNNTALHAAAANGNTEVAGLLLAHGALPRRNSYGTTPQALAHKYGHHETFALLSRIPQGLSTPASSPRTPTKQSSWSETVTTNPLSVALSPSSPRGR